MALKSELLALELKNADAITEAECLENKRVLSVLKTRGR